MRGSVDRRRAARVGPRCRRPANRDVGAEPVVLADGSTVIVGQESVRGCQSSVMAVLIDPSTQCEVDESGEMWGGERPKLPDAEVLECLGEFVE